MKIKWPFFAVLTAFLVLATSSSSKAVNTADIDKVLKKTVLDESDFKIIDDFLGEAIRDLVKTRDFTTIAQARTVILSRKSTQGQYAQRFSESALKQIQSGFEQAQALRPDDRKTNVNINLLILIDGLEDMRLANLAIPWLKDQNMVTRYWAVHALTNQAVQQQMNAAASSDPALARTIVDRLKEVVETSNPEILAQIARFAATVNIPQGEGLLLQVADVRIKSYAEWTVQHEFYDVGILKLLESKIPLSTAGSSILSPATGAGKAEVARRFAQLYSYVIQRYIKGKEKAVLNDDQKRSLLSVIIETEDKCISRLMEKPQTTIRRAVEKDSMTTLLEEHNKLLGADAAAGQLPSKLGFDYGSNRTAPIPLPDPPQKPAKPA